MSDTQGTAVLVELRFMSGTRAGTSLRLASNRIRMGRHGDAEVVFDAERERAVSAWHAVIERRGDALVLSDMGSHNGTWVNGEQVVQPRVIQPGDLLRLGGVSGPTLHAAVVGAPPEPKGKTTVGQDTLMAVVGSAVAAERSRSRRAITVLVLLLLLVAGGAGFGVWWLDQANTAERKQLAEALDRSASELTRLHDDQQRLTTQLAERSQALEQLRTNPADADRVAKSERELAELRETLKATQDRIAAQAESLRKAEEGLARSASGSAPDWPAIVKRHQTGIFLCVAINEGTGDMGIGTAFAITSDGLLVTNAHVVELLKGRSTRGVIQNETGRIFEIEAMEAHPGYSGPQSRDIGLIKLKGASDLVPLPLATDAQLRELQVGEPLGTLGYPGELGQVYLASLDQAAQRVKSAQATFKEGRLSRLTTFDFAGGQAVNFADKLLLQHSASLSGGTSGSPMFDARGVVVAVNNAGLDDHVLIESTATGAAPSVKRVANAAQIGFAIRADVVRELRAKAKW